MFCKTPMPGTNAYGMLAPRFTRTALWGGHPDVTAYESFEEDLLDRVLLYLARERKKRLGLYDVGCGSGRLHLRYAMKTTRVAQLKKADAQALERARIKNPAFAYDPLLAERLVFSGWC